MPGTSKKISELDSASSLGNSDLLEVAVVNALSETGYSSKKTTIEDIADKVVDINPQAQADWTEADNSDPSYIQNKPTLATVATSGSYNDLQDQPTIPAAQVNSDWNSVSGVSEILNKPTLGTAASKNTGVANGVAELDANGLVPTSQLPAYVDDVLEYASQSAFPATGETGKIYVALDTNLTYRWGGSAYVEISPSLALGETSSTAYAGNKGKANADAISAIQTTLSGLATVATTGEYDDLIGKPTIPTVNNATVTFTQGGTPKGSITLNQATDATIEFDAGGGGSGGHTILDDEGTSLTQRNDLQFKGAYSVDNSTDQITEVNVVREMTKAEFDLLTADEKVGIINVTDEGGSPDRNYSETEILSAPVQVGASSITLTDNISNYDLLVFELGVFAANMNQSFTSVALVSNIVNNPNDLTFISGATSDNDRLYSIYFGIKYSSETVLTIVYSNRTGWGETGQLFSIKGIKYGNGTQTFHNYSTAEQIVGTWIDGSTLYEKTIEKVVTCGSDQTIIDTTDIPNLNKIITVDGAFGGVPLTYYDTANYRSYIVIENSNHALKGYIKFGTTSSINSYFIIRYTKTTT